MRIPSEVYTDYRVWIGIAVLLVILTLKIIGTRTPQEKTFTCSKCRKREDHNQRTIRAWRKGKHQFFCKGCHQVWIRAKEPRHLIDSSAGCVSLLVFGFVASSAIIYTVLKS